jgi:hypothetical protein
MFPEEAFTLEFTAATEGPRLTSRGTIWDGYTSVPSSDFFSDFRRSTAIKVMVSHAL